MVDFLDWMLKIVGVFGVFLGLFLTKRHFGIVRAAQFAERFNSPQMFQVRRIVDRWLNEPPDDEVGKLNRLREDGELEANIRLFANVFQELGASFRAGYLSREYVRMTFDFLLPYYWKRLAFYVKWCRDRTGNRNMYRAFGLAAEQLEREAVLRQPQSQGDGT